MKNLRNNEAVSQLIGEIILLAIAVTSVSVLYTQVFAQPGPQETTEVTIIGKIEGGFPTFDLQRGESLGPDSTIKIIVNDNSTDLDRPPQTLRNYIGNNEWKIGDWIINKTEYVFDPINPPQVEATIIDTKTNAMVFWGILQKGTTSGHKGGLWHFNESYWSNINYDVNDSSGNCNNGTGRNMSQPRSEYGKSENGGTFSGYTDYIEVKTAWHLNITDAITVEAWMNPHLYKPTINTAEIPQNFGYTPYIISIGNNRYVIVSYDVDSGHVGQITTVSIDSYGNIDLDSLKGIPLPDGHNADSLQPMITQMTENICVVSYTDDQTPNNRMHVGTYTFLSDGTPVPISSRYFEDYACSASNPNPNRARLQKINDTLFAIAYWVLNGSKDTGIIKTVPIGLDGVMNEDDEIVTFEYNNTFGRDPCLVHVTGDIYALAYQGKTHGNLATFNISCSGDINSVMEIPFDTTCGREPYLIQVSGKVFALAYRNNEEGLIVKTFNIEYDGFITETGSIMEFENTIGCYNPYIIHNEGDNYIITCTTSAPGSGSTRGYASIINIGKTGFISSIIYNSLKLIYWEDIDKPKPKLIEVCSNPMILRISEDIYAVVFTGQTHTGILRTIFVPQSKFPADKGITKPGSYGIYSTRIDATTIRIWGSINNISVITNVTNVVGTPPSWHHVAVTFDGDKIKLYIDGQLKPEWIKDVPFTKITTTKDDLYFGRYYNGYIDEIGIYEEALPLEKIQDNMYPPGNFRHYLFQ